MIIASLLFLFVGIAALGLTCGHSPGFWDLGNADYEYLEARMSRLEAKNKKLQKSIQGLQNNMVHCVSGRLYSNSNKNLVRKYHYTKSFHFPKPFRNVPEVMIGFEYIDLIKGTNTRISARKKVTKDKLTVTFRSWADTIFFYAGVSFMACGKI